MGLLRSIFIFGVGIVNAAHPDSLADTVSATSFFAEPASAEESKIPPVEFEPGMSTLLKLTFALKNDESCCSDLQALNEKLDGVTDVGSFFHIMGHHVVGREEEPIPALLREYIDAVMEISDQIDYFQSTLFEVADRYRTSAAPARAVRAIEASKQFSAICAALIRAINADRKPPAATPPKESNVPIEAPLELWDDDISTYEYRKLSPDHMAAMQFSPELKFRSAFADAIAWAEHPTWDFEDQMDSLLDGRFSGGTSRSTEAHYVKEIELSKYFDVYLAKEYYQYSLGVGAFEAAMEKYSAIAHANPSPTSEATLKVIELLRGFETFRSKAKYAPAVLPKRRGTGIPPMAEFVRAKYPDTDERGYRRVVFPMYTIYRPREGI